MKVRLFHRRRAVSPVIAAILLIALAVATVGIVYVIVQNLSDVDAEIVVEDQEFSDVNGNYMVDKIIFDLRNVGAEATNVTSVTFVVDSQHFISYCFACRSCSWS